MNITNIYLVSFLRDAEATFKLITQQENWKRYLLVKRRYQTKFH